MADEPLIQIRNLHKTLGTQKVLCGVDLDIFRGETLVVFGRSGGGKSVLLKHLIGLLSPTSGEIHVEGQNLFALNERQMGAIRKKIAMLFQGAALFDSMNVEDNIAFPLKESGITSKETLAKEVANALELVDLSGEQKKMPSNLSGGMKKRVGLARAIVTKPACILYDEPTTGLDPIVADSINWLIRRLQKRLHVTSIVVTHDMKSAFDVADRIAYLHEGQIYFQGTPEEMRSSEDPLIKDFIMGRSGDSD